MRRRASVLGLLACLALAGQAQATNITCGSNRNGGVETDTITTLRGEADVTIRDTGEHYTVGEGQQLTVRGGQVQQQQVDANQNSQQWNQQLQNMGSGVDMGDIPGILRNIRENEGTLIRNLRSSLEGANRSNAPALLKAVDRAIGVLDEDAMTMNNFMRRVREASGRPDQGLVAAIADCLRSNASYRTDVGAMLRQLRQIESLELGEIPGRLESLRSSLANGMNAIQEAKAAIPEGTSAAAPAMIELRQRVAEYQQTLAGAEAETGRIQRQLSDVINAGQGNVQQARAMARQAAALNDAIAGYRQTLRRYSAALAAGSDPDAVAREIKAMQAELGTNESLLGTIIQELQKGHPQSDPAWVDETIGRLQECQRSCQDIGRRAQALLDKDPSSAELKALLRRVSGDLTECNSKLTLLSQAGREAQFEKDKARLAQVYTDLAAAYRNRDAHAVEALLGPDWVAGDGSDRSAVARALSDSFAMFDTVEFSVSGLKLEALPAARGAVASYELTITGRIWRQKITHVEKSSVVEELTVGPGERVLIAKTRSGRIWFVE
jgi:hypothetical protein